MPVLVTRVPKSHLTLTTSLVSVIYFQRGVECCHFQSMVLLVAPGFYEVICNQVKHGKHGLRDGLVVSV